MADDTQSDSGAGVGTETNTTNVGSGAFGLNTQEQQLPPGVIRFGLESAQNDYVVPLVRFTFYDPFGYKRTNPTEVSIRMGGAFNSTITNSYSPVSGIFGKPSQTGAGGIVEDLKGMFNKLSESAIGSLQLQILQAIAGTTGFLASAGLSAKQQIEFLNRKMLNNYNQLIYQGPNYRRFQLPFNMKASSKQESIYAQEIIQVFRTVSSPKTGNDAQVAVATPEEAAGIDLNEISGNYPLGPEAVLNDPKASEEAKKAAQEALQQVQNYTVGNQRRGSYELAKASDVFTFGYPDMCRFDIILMNLKNKTVLDVLFKSDYCVIDAVSVDYGSGNKMSFYTDYRPTDINMSLSLQEINFHTAGQATNPNNFKIQ